MPEPWRGPCRPPGARGARRVRRWRRGREVRSREQGARRRAAPPPAQPRAYKGPNHRASIRTPSPDAWCVAGGRRRGGSRRKPGSVRGLCRAGRSYRRPVAPCRIRGSAAPEAADTGLGGVPNVDRTVGNMCTDTLNAVFFFAKATKSCCNSF